MQWTLRILSTLLRYPDEGVKQVAPVLLDALERDNILTPRQRETLRPLVDQLIADDLLDLQERYVALFDRGRALSLHLFEHVHGESRDRGQAMVDLRARYEAQGLEISARELPDYLPLFLEYLSTLPADQAVAELAQPGVIIGALSERLDEKDTPYAAPMRLLADMAGAVGEQLPITPPDDPDDLAALDALWEEEQVRFEAPAAPGTAAACPQASAMVARFQSLEPGRSFPHG
ncbi:MAG: nitrate reductase molybdenum cofactor assembly chaperone [Sphingobium sp.]|jgi:nitrate reductase delta subunit|nr:nitrate reductase molybdenum cofactor assembly chaperone [Sphingobium sp.]MCI1272020.1 nitrate reductase molybdenum cofactor assembly chaperone [Sphingobium sp.]MCI1755852.1 nitrate reductase molybdenum cofactor assembly chaperone [Sphingobium sp.]MCI2052217.1 nitrate reductase molybdenum cofactor assembly chaperone [Sphingobium sp.]